MNPLEEHPAARRVAYYIQWTVNLILGVIAVVLTTLGESPLWFVIATGVANFVWTYTGLTAAQNVQE